MGNVLLLVHGMGEHPPHWSADIVAKLDSVAAQYPAFASGKKFSQRLTAVEEVTYDDILSTTVESWQNDATQLDAWAKASALPLPKIVNWLRKPLPAEAKGFFWTTAIDPLLYRGFHLVRDDVRAHVTARIAKILDRALANGDANVTVVAHSLGTIVVHDALELLARGYEGNTVLSAAKYKLTNVFMLADVCLLARKLVADIDYFGPHVRPTSAGPPDSTYCEFFVNVWHRYDPFAVLAAFRPTEWGSGYIPIGPLQHFRNANVHGFTHYLDHPLVHVPIINAALGPTADGTDPITESDQATVLLDYPDTPTMACDAQIAQIKQQALALTQAADLEETIIGIAEFLATARQAADACKPLFSKDMFA